MVDIRQIYKLAEELDLKLPINIVESDLVKGVNQFPYGRSLQITIEFFSPIRKVELDDVTLFVVDDIVIGAYNSVYYDLIYERYGKLLRVEDKAIVYISGPEEARLSMEEYFERFFPVEEYKIS